MLIVTADDLKSTPVTRQRYSIGNSSSERYNTLSRSAWALVTRNVVLVLRHGSRLINARRKNLEISEGVKIRKSVAHHGPVANLSRPQYETIV